MLLEVLTRVTSFTFSLLLPATLATTDHHQFGRLSYILTARVEGIPASGITAFFKHTSSSPSAIPPTSRSRRTLTL
jgi:hypothetical protein